MDKKPAPDDWDGVKDATKRRIALVYLGFALSAYAPLALMLGAIYISKSMMLAVVCFAVAAVLACSVGLVVSNRARKVGSRIISFSQRQEQGDAVAGYLATFIIPFLAVPTSNLGVGIAYLIFFLIALYLQTRSKLGLINPTLYLLGWRVSRIEVRAGAVFLVHKTNLPSEAKIRAVAFSGIFIEKQKGCRELTRLA